MPMLTCGEAKGSAKSCPATDPGDRKHELRRPERRSGSDRAGQERAYRLSLGWTGLLVARIERRRACRWRARRRARQTAIRFQPACSYWNPLASCVGANARHDRLRLRRPHAIPSGDSTDERVFDDMKGCALQTRLKHRQKQKHISWSAVRIIVRSGLRLSGPVGGRRPL